jgi:hypothetical protein
MANITLSVNDNNDIYLDSKGNIALVYDRDAVLQQCAQQAKTLLGEMIYQTDQGIPYFQAVWVGVPNLTLFTAYLRAALLSVSNVVDVVSLITSQDNNTLLYSAIIRTTYGVGNINESVTP